jgi:hypothetical protein
MTPDEMRVRIAELLGFTNVHRLNKWKEGTPHSDGTLVGDRDGLTKRPLQNYDTSLDACAEFEATLTDDEHFEFRSALYDLAMKEDASHTIQDCARQTVSATALQRCEAFLRVKGEWR